MPHRLAALLAAGFALAGCGAGPPPQPADSGLARGPQEVREPGAMPATTATGHGIARSGRFVAGAAATSGASLPDDIVRALSTDERVLACADGVADGRSAFEPEWVLARTVDLDGDGRDDWLVEGRHACLAGNDGADWWVYAGDSAGRRLLLAGQRARVVELRPAPDGGFADLRLERTDGRSTLLRHEDTAYLPVPSAD